MDFVKCYFCIYWDDYVFLYILSFWYGVLHSLIFFQMLKQSCNPDTNLTWLFFCDYFCMLDSVVSILWVFFMSILTRDIILCFSCDLLVSFCCQDNTEAIWAWAFFSVGNFKMTNSIPLLLYVCSNLLFLFEPISLVCSQDFILFMIFYLLPYNCL